MELAESFRFQADACARLGSPMYGELLTRAAEDIDAGGVVPQVLEGHEQDPGPSALALRLAGSVHRLVLSGRAPTLAGHYPSVGGRWEQRAGWRAFSALLAEQPAAVREWLDRPPQTNEVGRSAALMGGLLQLERSARLPVRLYEMGASGGLNLRVERFAFATAEGAVHGDPLSPVRLEGAWRGRTLTAWPDLRVVSRLGCDPMPVNVATLLGRLTLTSYVWPDQEQRLTRLRSAFVVAARHPAVVRAEPAHRFVAGVRLQEGATTVLWHSVMRQYLSHHEQDAVAARVEELGSQATARAPFVYLFLEPTRRSPGSPHEFLVVLRVWPVGEPRILGSAHPHGVPVSWE